MRVARALRKVNFYSSLPAAFPLLTLLETSGGPSPSIARRVIRTQGIKIVEPVVLRASSAAWTSATLSSGLGLPVSIRTLPSAMTANRSAAAPVSQLREAV